MIRVWAGVLLAVAPAHATAAAPAVRTAVEVRTPERAAVRTIVSPGNPLAQGSGFHGLSGDPEQGWRRSAMQHERDAAGGLVFASEVAAGPDGWFRVPIPIPDAPPAAGTDLSFAAAITPPPGYRIVDLFPVGAASDTGSGAVALRLPAPPSLLRFGVAPEDAAGIGLAAVVDGAVALLLIGLAGFGIRRLLRPGDPADGPE